MCILLIPMFVRLTIAELEPNAASSKSRVSKSSKKVSQNSGKKYNGKKQRKESSESSDPGSGDGEEEDDNVTNTEDEEDHSHKKPHHSVSNNTMKHHTQALLSNAIMCSFHQKTCTVLVSGAHIPLEESILRRWALALV